MKHLYGFYALKTYLPARVVIDDSGGPFSGWPSVCGSNESDVTLIYREGFVRHWGDLSQGEALALAHFIVDALNKEI